MLASFRVADGCLVQLPELRNLRFILQRAIGTAYPVGIQPAQQVVKWLHAAVKYPDADNQDGEQQDDVQKNNPSQHGVFQVVLLDRRCRYGKLVILSFVIFE